MGGIEDDVLRFESNRDEWIQLGLGVGGVVSLKTISNFPFSIRHHLQSIPKCDLRRKNSDEFN